jgi:SAM-dependent methyltransferase
LALEAVLEDIMQINKPVSDMFAQEFISKPLDKQIAFCDRNQLAPLFLRLFKDHQPVLEAGCGSGRWNGWFYQNGISSDGADWSAELCGRAQAHLPDCHFYVCDLKDIPVPDESYGGIIALGSIEQSKDGPLAILKEFHRILKKDGLAVVTVPYGGRWRKLRMLLIDRPLLRLKAVNMIRKVLKKSTRGLSLSQARIGVNNDWWPVFSHGGQGWHFYEYEFNKGQMQTFLKNSGFCILEESVINLDDGIYHNLRPLFVRWDPEEEVFSFSIIGKIARRILPDECSPQQAAGYQTPKPNPSKQLHLDLLTMELLIRFGTALFLDILAYDFFIAMTSNSTDKVAFGPKFTAP